MSELDLYTKYLDLGVKLGRSGEDLTTWVENKVRQDVERSERQIERERKREEMEMQKQREEKEMEMQKQREELAFRREEKEREREMQREEKEKERQLELRRMELEAETKKLEIGSRAGVDVSGPRQSYGAQRPKIPPLHDPSQVDLYLERFERHAAALGWPESEWASFASAYMDARPNKSFRKKHSVSFVAKLEPYRSTVRVSERRHDSRPHESGGRFNSSSKGHRSPSFQGSPNVLKRSTSRSPSRDRSKPNVFNKNVGQGQFRPSSGNFSSDITCFQCGGRGHFLRECPSHPKEANFSSSVPDSSSHSCECPSKPKEANVAFSVPKLPYHCCAAKMDSSPSGGLKIESCKVFDRVSTLLRDSGCNTVGVSKSLVPPDCYTGKSMLINTFRCRDQLFPTCMINIKTPYFTGDVEACLMDSPIADVILGNINGLSSKSSPFDSDSSDVFPNSSFACVITRA
ncbi:reverse transcriptase [Plakobranchus ocellatus]|uniref:Reverse transcriptase n=1 Tax=Plakobranchus ocellatus TaxID=259542 RepID=A0AAV3YB59_9GAST|nr:reverse transcriptase [Plakobranchus ocellatus]